MDDQVEADVNAAKACKTERKTDPNAFAEKHGSSRNKRHAFGKCVSKQAKTLQDDQSSGDLAGGGGGLLGRRPSLVIRQPSASPAVV